MENNPDFECEEIANMDDLTDEDDHLLVVRFATKPEAEAYCEGVTKAAKDSRSIANHIDKIWYAVVQFYDGADRPAYEFIDRSLPWNEFMQ